MRITKLKIKNLYGIKEYEATGNNVELAGSNGTGKTSVIDAIRYALTNKSTRDYIVRQGESEGEIIIETDNGLLINRKARVNQADYKSIKQNGRDVQSPESFLREIFTELQLSPVEFLNMDKKEQNRIILDMIEFPWDMEWIKEQFGEIPSGVNWEQNILQILSDIQAESGDYFQERQNINRDARNKKAFIEEIAQTIPVGYQAETWHQANLSDIYKKIETIRHENEAIEKAQRLLENRENKVRKYQADKEIEISAINTEIGSTKTRIEKDIMKFEEQIRALKTELGGLEEKKQNKLALIEQTYKANIAEYDAELKEYEKYLSQVPKDITDLLAEAKQTEDMKSHLNEYHRMVGLQREVETLVQCAEDITEKIEKARTLPGEILETATIPVKGLTVKDGIPLINGLPVSNLSEGEKLDLCIDVAVQKPNALQLILIDGVEKLSTVNRERLYQKCKDKGLQFIATRTTDDNDLTIIEL